MEPVYEIQTILSMKKSMVIMLNTELNLVHWFNYKTFLEPDFNNI